MYKNKAEQAAAEARMAKRAKVWMACVGGFILLSAIAGYSVFGLDALL